jgi:RNA polymerase sigma factor (sigma-70 family)
MLDAPTTDEQLVASASDPDNAVAWSHVFAKYRSPLLRLCQRSGLSPDEAEEVVQEVLIKLSRRLAKAPLNWEASSLRGWLSETCNRAIFDHHRRCHRTHLSGKVIAAIKEWLPPAFAPESDDGTREQLEAHLWSVCLARVRHAARPGQWQIFEAYALHGATAVEVARRFNTTGFNVRVIRHRMVARIRREWAQLASCPLPDQEA